ncbi:CYP enzymes assisting alcohol dehydrogenase-like isoform X2 [Macadamia integrifolia]|uniref:CYP enzymes assisting alcohol dehydrogenase-like isoform X2 n=1 Tax=Macadamia integrifolia TaxID=60698 RepID=UPI001C4E3D30|nr:CYP enzymes assisting alcohol dehydrogenase-like isoform X2 [Macadamia integrifolia]
MSSGHGCSQTISKSSSQAITCRAAVCWGAEELLKIEEVEVEPPRSSEVRVKILFASVCHTDILRWKGRPLAFFPRVLGHEGVGIVESIGEGVTNLKEGDLVIPTFIGECQECRNCLSGKTNICENYPLHRHGLMPDLSSRMHVRGQRLYHMFTCATWSEYTVVNVNYVTKIDPRVPLPHASLISCGFSTGFGATWKETKIERGSTVAVFGLGGVGLGVIIGARMRGASKIIGIDLNESKKEKGEFFGMTDFIKSGQSHQFISQEIKEMTKGVGVDYSFECTGVEPLINEALESTAVGTGVTISIGISEKGIAPINLVALLSGSRTLKGSVFGGIKPQTDLPTIIEKCINKEIELDALVSHEVQLEDINQAFELLKQPDCLKIVIQVNKSLSC